MAMITVNVTITKTVAEASGTTFEAVRSWVKTNIRDKLPVDATMTEFYQINP